MSDNRETDGAGVGADTDTAQRTTGDPRLIEKLRKVMALTTSPVEGEAQAAMAMLQKLLLDHNLTVADLEARGHKGKPGVQEAGYDLGKAAFKWKLNLAEAIAEFYFCWPIVDHKEKTVKFIGRPDNVESLKMLYKWVIEQIAGIAREERRNHFIRTNEHIDPLRWQVNFGLGAVSRLRNRLAELKERQAADVKTEALVVSHRSEISDYMEAVYGRRIDGRLTKEQEESERRWQNFVASQRKAQEEREELRRTDYTRYCQLYPHDTDEARAARALEDEKWRKEQERKERKRERDRERRAEGGGSGYRYRPYTEADRQADDAKAAGRRGAEKVNLQPFLRGGVDGRDQLD